MMQPLSFIANIGLKDIVGRELINNDNIAIVELIKNSKDAKSDGVEIKFSGAIRPEKNSMLIIQDSGHGMSLDDIKNKWLNIAYSEKKNASKQGQSYAGSKGIGRFSCDRLGKKLDLYTKSSKGELIWLPINWTDFEVHDQDRQINSVPLSAKLISDADFTKSTGIKRFNSGTVLVIKELRNSWGEEMLEGLRKELERFVVDPSNEFSVFLYTDDFNGNKKLNGKIENKIFDKLDFRTTSIHSSVVENGKVIKTILKHDGNTIFTLKEKNSYEHLNNINVSIYYLNQPAKAFFKKETGYRSVDFGSVFLFLNSFRIFPYGDEADDWLALDRRKQQGHNRFLGTREIVGLVEVGDDNNVFLPVSSREGLVNNDAYLELAASGDEVKSKLDGSLQYGYIHKIFRKLEKFVVDGLDWDRVTENIADENEEWFLKSKNIEFINRNRHILANIEAVIALRSPEKHIIDIDLNLKYLLELAKKESAEYKELIGDLQQKFKGVPIAKMKPSEKRDLSKFIARQAKELAAKAASNQKLQEQSEALTKEKAEAERKLKVETKRRLFAEAVTTLDYKHVLNMHHQIGLLAGDVFKRLDRMIRRYNKNPDAMDKKELIETIEKSLFSINKIRQASKFATKANFDMATNNVKEDLIQFLEEYIQNICKNGIDWGLKIQFENNSSLKLVRTFRPIEATIVIDNIIDNASKAFAKNLLVRVSKQKGHIRITFIDNGKGVDTSKYKFHELLQKGITTTEGSGMGLHHVQEIISDMEGSIRIYNNPDKGACVLLEFPE